MDGLEAGPQTVPANNAEPKMEPIVGPPVVVNHSNNYGNKLRNYLISC